MATVLRRVQKELHVRIGGTIGFKRFLSTGGEPAFLSDESSTGSVHEEQQPERAIESGSEVSSLTPRRIVEQLDRHIIGQSSAKRAVSVALRNRWRRHHVDEFLKQEITPKNILMIGPTGVGKTEIARRLAKLADAPFVKVEATKFTEVGFHGRDVDQIVRDLVDNSFTLAKQRLRERKRKQVQEGVEERLLEALVGEGADDATKESMRSLLRNGDLEDRSVEVDTPSRDGRGMFDNSSGAIPMQEFIMRVDRLMGSQRSERKQLKVSEARPMLEDQELERLADSDAVQREALNSAEKDGIVFIDEIDKIVSNSRYGSADASSEGVQRDLLPIIEGSSVQTKYGNINTDHILFIASGAFHSCKPSDMLAELQGRLPVRVELQPLTKEDLHRILTEPEANVLQQHISLLRADGINLQFTEEAVNELSNVATEINTNVDNIGARRLHTIMERVVDDISYTAPDLAEEWKQEGKQLPRPYKIDSPDIRNAVGDLLKKSDLNRYVL